MKRLLLLAPLLLVAGCADRARASLTGRWTGGFDVSKVTGKLQTSDPKRNDWQGSIQLYLTDTRCSMHLEGEQEAVDLQGHWHLNHKQIVVRFDSVKIDDAGGAEGRNPNKAFIAPADLQAAFAIPMTLDITEKGKALESPLVQIGPLLGSYRFSKDSLAR